MGNMSLWWPWLGKTAQKGLGLGSSAKGDLSNPLAGRQQGVMCKG